MIKGRKLISVLLAGMMLVSFALTAGATDIKNMQKEEQELQNQRDEAAAEEKTLTERVNQLSASMKEAERKLDQKRAEIDETEQELIMARVDENEQYKSMKLRIRYMYENGNVNLMEIFLESDGLADFFHKAEYIKQMSEYDRKKLDEFQLTVKTVEEKEVALQAEYDDLAVLQDSLAKQRKEAENLLATKSSELAKLQADLDGIKKQIKDAEDEEKKRQEAPSSSGNASNSGNGGGSQVTVKPPVVSGNGYFTHPCPGMSYQSSYFGEIRYGIGDERPHKGHDYAAPAGTPIYAAAAGEVIIAGYSSSAGNWVVIDHGDGLTTKYMHMYRTPLVSVGQQVVKGQHIGGVGTTGQSTGNHLHFQVEEYGKPVDPSKYM